MEKIYQKHDTQHVAALVVYESNGQLFPSNAGMVSFDPKAEFHTPWEPLRDAYLNGSLCINWNGVIVKPYQMDDKYARDPMKYVEGCLEFKCHNISPNGDAHLTITTYDENNYQY